MDTERTEAIVLRRQPVTETSLIVTWFTRDFGKLKTMAKGARRLKGPFQGRIDLFYRDEIAWLRSKRSALHLLVDCFLENAHAPLRGSVATLTAASYAAELVELATEMEDPNPKVFELLETVLTALEQGRNDGVLIWFELQLLTVCGWGPPWDTGSGAGRILASLAGTNLAGARRVQLTETQVRTAREELWRFWDAELGQAPRSRKWLGPEIRY